MSDFFVIAEEELVLAFRMAGADGRAVSGRDEAVEAFRAAVGRGAAAPSSAGGASLASAAPRPKVLVLTDDVADMIGREAEDWQAGGEYPLIVEIPPQAARREGRKGLADLVREAIGITI